MALVPSLITGGSFAHARGHTTTATTPVIAPCVTATNSCVSWVGLGSGRARTMTYSTYPLTTVNSTIRRALIMVHGSERAADSSFRTAMAAALLDNALQDTLIVAPHLITDAHVPQPDEVVWPDTGNSWRSGGESTSNPGLYSFDVADQVVRLLANKAVFPNLKRIVVAGHSAGGQYAARYAMASKVHDTTGVTISYVVANPSSYAWPDAQRPLAQGDDDPATAAQEWESTDVQTAYAYGPFDSGAASCSSYNRWPAGLQGRTGYTAAMTDADLRAHAVTRSTRYLFGQLDVFPLSNFDDSCIAMAQGPTRRARGEAYVEYLQSLGSTNTARIVEGCGHSSRCMFDSDTALSSLFP
jgi:pimeloyl-ACP methyl ester carboxylesterase